MNRRRRWATGCWAAAALCLAAGVVNANELAIPRGYFNSSGGFFRRSSQGPPCWYYTPAGGCTVDVDYCTALLQATSCSDSALASRSWYAGDVVLYGGRAIACPACLGPSGEDSRQREEVAPVPVVPRGDSR